MLPAWVDRLIVRAREADGQPPFSDQALVDARSGERSLLAVQELGAAIVSETEAELVVDPDARGRGHGTALLETVIARSRPGLLVWAHGDHPAARALAARFGFEPVRRLLQLRLELSSGSSLSRPHEELPVGEISTSSIHSAGSIRSIRGFTTADAEAWLDLNARAFASHPEQGGVTRDDLDAMMAEPWFDASDFLVLREGEQMIAFCWLKVEHGIGELYAVGVDPDRQGEGLGRRVVAAGLSRLAERRIRASSLYVEADNATAVALYESFGYSEYSVDVQYSLVRS